MKKNANKKGKSEKFLKQAQRRAKAGRSRCSRAKCDAGQSVTEGHTKYRNVGHHHNTKTLVIYL